MLLGLTNLRTIQFIKDSAMLKITVFTSQAKSLNSPHGLIHTKAVLLSKNDSYSTSYCYLHPYKFFNLGTGRLEQSLRERFSGLGRGGSLQGRPVHPPTRRKRRRRSHRCAIRTRRHAPKSRQPRRRGFHGCAHGRWYGCFPGLPRARTRARPPRYVPRPRGNYLSDLSKTGALAVGVPGTVDGMAKAHARFGSMPWADLVAPAISLARAKATPSPTPKPLP